MVIEGSLSKGGKCKKDVTKTEGCNVETKSNIFHKKTEREIKRL